ncbi:hypothetical protein OC861_004020 [Tilletia horrida]|nr:hypothetical protein OC861_004020 [Tilletia horrida]
MIRKEHARDHGPGPIAALLSNHKASAQEHRIQELLQVITSPVSVLKQRLAALAKIEQHLASTVLSGDPHKQAAWWALQRNQRCNGTTSKSAHSSQSTSTDFRLALASSADADLLAEELVACLSILQGLAILMLVLNAHQLAGQDLTAPACHALDLLMCVLVDASDALSELFETLGGIDQISAVWKARAEVVAMRKAAARVEREAARMRGIDYQQDNRKARLAKARPASEDAVKSSPQQQKRRARSDCEFLPRPATPPAPMERGNGRRTPNAKIRSPNAPSSPNTPLIPQRNSSSNDAEANDVLSSPSSPQQKQRLLSSPTPRATRINRGRASHENFYADERPCGLVRTRSPIDDGDSSSSNSTHHRRQDPTDPKRTTSSSPERRQDKMKQTESEGEDEPDELCEKCIEFLIFYLQPELLEKEAKREQRRRAKLANDPALQLGLLRAPAQARDPKAPKAHADRRPARGGNARPEAVATHEECPASIPDQLKSRGSPIKPSRKQALRRV